MKNLALEFKATIDSENGGLGITQKAWAERAGLPVQSAVTRLLEGARPGPSLLKALVSNWSNPETGKRIIAAYLKDEATRAGLCPEDIQITV